MLCCSISPLGLSVRVIHDTLRLALKRGVLKKDYDRRKRSPHSCQHEAGFCADYSVEKHILVVDDKNELLHLMRRVLEDEQYQVYILQEGRDAFSRVKAQLPDLLILDLRLGDISGQDILKQLKDDPVTADIPVIVYTAAVLEAEEVIKLIESDPDHYQRVYVVQKPFELESLLALVKRTLEEPVDSL
jgi:CheY-like chemotaxis protein